MLDFIYTELDLASILYRSKLISLTIILMVSFLRDYESSFKRKFKDEVVADAFRANLSRLHRGLGIRTRLCCRLRWGPSCQICIPGCRVAQLHTEVFDALGRILLRCDAQIARGQLLSKFRGLCLRTGCE